MNTRLPATLATLGLLYAGGPSAQGHVRLGVEGRANATPWADARGAVVAVAWGATPPGGKADVFVAISRDSGATFAAPVRVNEIEGEPRLGGELPPRVAIVPATSGGPPEIVVAYGAKGATTAIKIRRSRDGGRTFRPEQTLSAPGAAGDRGWQAMTLDATGRAHVMWLDHRGMAARKASGDHQHHEAAAMDGAKMAQLSGLYYATGTPDVSAAASAKADLSAVASAKAEGLPRQGNDWSERELAKGVCYCCKVAMTTTAGGAIYSAWRHVYPGNIRDIAFNVSRDGGRTFSTPARVSTDEWQLAGCPDDGPAMAADDKGAVHLVWPTVIGGATPEGAIFYASSPDGRSFSARQRVPTLGSARPMHPQVAVTRTGALIVAWDEVIAGVRQAALRAVTLDAQGRATFGPERRLSAPGAPSSYPMVVMAARGPLAVWVDAGQVAVSPALR